MRSGDEGREELAHFYIKNQLLTDDQEAVVRYFCSIPAVWLPIKNRRNLE
jgi:hypothetical protein